MDYARFVIYKKKKKKKADQNGFLVQLNSFIFVGVLLSVDHREKHRAKYDWIYCIYLLLVGTMGFIPYNYRKLS